jgi:N-acetylglucosamine kinase-like BadF-type ATPase
LTALKTKAVENASKVAAAITLKASMLEEHNALMAFGIGSEGMTAEDEAEKTIFIRP